MTRGKILAVAVAVGMLMGTVAHAASPLTLKCVSAQSKKLRDCLVSCRNDFKSNRASCYGPGATCATQCSSDNDACLKPVNDAIAACNGACASAQRDAIDICKSQFQNGTINQDQLDSCANAARAANLDCKLTCTDNNDEARLACSQQLGACLASCASCGTPDQCPTN